MTPGPLETLENNPEDAGWDLGPPITTTRSSQSTRNSSGSDHEAVVANSGPFGQPPAPDPTISLVALAEPPGCCRFSNQEFWTTQHWCSQRCIKHGGTTPRPRRPPAPAPGVPQPVMRPGQLCLYYIMKCTAGSELGSLFTCQSAF